MHATLLADPPTTAPPFAKLTEAEALEQLRAMAPGDRPTVRALAETWGWSRSTTQRFITDYDASLGQGAAGECLSHHVPDQTRDNGDSGVRTHEQLRTLLVNGAKDFQAKFPQPTPEQSADDFINERLLATAADPGPSDGFDWSEENTDVIIRRQKEIAVYLNPFDQVVLRAAREFEDEDDTVIVVSRLNVPALIAALQNILQAELVPEARR